MDNSDKLSYRQVRVGQFTIGMNGLSETFSTLRAEGNEPGPAVIPMLLARVRQHNYVPTSAEEVYAEALLREFRDFCQRQGLGCSCATNYGTWRGHPREAIPWYPTISIDRCDGCEACLRFCPNGVFAPGRVDGVQVVEPFKCQVGCDACMRVCRPGAITFPPKEVLEVYGR